MHLNIAVLLLLATVCIHAKIIKDHNQALRAMGHQMPDIVKRDAKAGAACPAFSCVADGQACSMTVECSIDSYCNGGTCTALTKAGGNCQNDDTCVDTADCIINTSTGTGTCTTVTFSGTVGTACSEAAQCTSGLYCSQDTNLCTTPPSAAGQACVPNIGCAGALDCSPVTLTCYAYFSVPVGANCTQLLDCTPTNWCNDNGICAALPASSNTPCTSNADCPSVDENCDCTISATASTATCIGPFGYTAQQATDLTTFFNCEVSANCAADICSKCTANACAFFKSNFPTPTGLTCFTNAVLYHTCNKSGASSLTPLCLFVTLSAAFLALM